MPPAEINAFFWSQSIKNALGYEIRLSAADEPHIRPIFPCTVKADILRGFLLADGLVSLSRMKSLMTEYRKDSPPTASREKPAGFYSQFQKAKKKSIRAGRVRMQSCYMAAQRKPALLASGFAGPARGAAVLQAFEEFSHQLGQLLVPGIVEMQPVDRVGAAVRLAPRVDAELVIEAEQRDAVLPALAFKSRDIVG